MEGNYQEIIKRPPHLLGTEEYTANSTSHKQCYAAITPFQYYIQSIAQIYMISLKNICSLGVVVSHVNQISICRCPFCRSDDQTEVFFHKSHFCGHGASLKYLQN